MDHSVLFGNMVEILAPLHCDNKIKCVCNACPQLMVNSGDCYYFQKDLFTYSERNNFKDQNVNKELFLEDETMKYLRWRLNIELENLHTSSTYTIYDPGQVTPFLGTWLPFL